MTYHNSNSTKIQDPNIKQIVLEISQYKLMISSINKVKTNTTIKVFIIEIIDVLVFEGSLFS